MATECLWPSIKKIADKAILIVCSGSRQTAILRALEADLLYQLLSVSVGKQKRGAEVTGTGLQRTDAILASAVLPLEFYLEVFDAVGRKEILQDHHSLRTAVAVAFRGKRYFNIIVNVFGQFAGIAGAQGIDDVIHAVECPCFCSGYTSAAAFRYTSMAGEEKQDNKGQRIELFHTWKVRSAC